MSRREGRDSPRAISLERSAPAAKDEQLKDRCPVNFRSHLIHTRGGMAPLLLKCFPPLGLGKTAHPRVHLLSRILTPVNGMG